MVIIITTQNGTFMNYWKYSSLHCLKQHKKYMEGVKKCIFT